VACVTCDFVDTTFVILWGGAVGLVFHGLFYRVGASERYSYVGVF
jgi:hypothetical protein